MMLKCIFFSGGELNGTHKKTLLQNGHRKNIIPKILKINKDTKNHNHHRSLLAGSMTGKTIIPNRSTDIIKYQYFFLSLRNRRSLPSLLTEDFLLVIKQVFHLVNCFFNPFPDGLNHPLHRPHLCAAFAQYHSKGTTTRRPS